MSDQVSDLRTITAGPSHIECCLGLSSWHIKQAELKQDKTAAVQLEQRSLSQNRAIVNHCCVIAILTGCQAVVVGPFEMPNHTYRLHKDCGHLTKVFCVSRSSVPLQRLPKRSWRAAACDQKLRGAQRRRQGGNEIIDGRPLCGVAGTEAGSLSGNAHLLRDHNDQKHDLAPRAGLQAELIQDCTALHCRQPVPWHSQTHSPRIQASLYGSKPSNILALSPRSVRKRAALSRPLRCAEYSLHRGEVREGVGRSGGDSQLFVTGKTEAGARHACPLQRGVLDQY